MRIIGIDEITTVSPSGFLKSALAKYPEVPGAWYVNITWTPSASDVNKLHILCFTATDKKGLTSQQRCINLIVTPDVTNNRSDGIKFDYGLINDDSLIGVNDGKCKLVSKEYEIPVFRSTYSKIFVCITGIITFDGPFESPGTVDGSDLKGKTILAPYFNDIDRDSLRYGGNVYYHVYNSIKGDINESSNVRTAQEFIQQIHGDVGNFIAQFALFVTWHQVRPSRTKTGQNERMNFQLALLTDGVNTFAFYVYPKNGIKLKSQLVYIGFTTKDGEKYTDYRSFTSAVLAIDILAISFGYTGLLHYRLSFRSLGPKSSRQDCIDWYLNERKYKDEYQEGLEKMPLCPCDTSHLARDQFYSDNDYLNQGDAFCTYIRPNWQFRPKDSGKTCCYDKTNRYFVGYGSNSGGFIRYHPNKQALKHKSYDKDMRTACCEENNLCSLYHSVRPIGQCYTIFPAWHAPARGDPHFKTLDGQNYTFNGWGEFTLVTINSSTEEFELQARTSRVVTKDGNMSDATAFTAFAATETNDVKVHIEMNAAKNDLIVYAKMAPSLMLSDYTSDYTNMDKEFNIESDYMSLSRRNQTKNVMAVFASGIAVTVGISVNMLNIDVLIPNKFQNMTAGLLGNFDGDPTNDFRFKNGSVLWGTVGEKDIFNFGKSWVVDPNHSAFWYPQGKGYSDYSHLNYTPTFLEDLDTAKVASARDVCGEEEYECIFDLVLTEDEEVANETRRLGYVARQVDALLENEAPSISGPSTINVTINNTITYQLSAFDDGEYSYRILDGQMYANITDQKNGTAVVTVLLQEDRPINVKATVVDEFGAQATPHQIVIVVCATCNQRGTCDFAEFRDDNRTTDSFKYATCRCDPYWDGPDCEMDRDGCATQPCSPLRKCTDIPADLHKTSGVGYNCTDCPVGFTSINDGRCEDIDECSSSNGGCSQICNNTYGTFSCSCLEGYRKQTGVCQDINECSEASNDCDQICSNSIGGYNCSCYEGFIFNSVTRSCEEGVLPSGCNSLNCSGTAGCTTDKDGNATCFCPKGYQLNSDGETCNDINECQLPICQHRCTNTEGSFYCSCFNGYSIQSDRSSCKECELSKYGENCNNTCTCGQGAIRCDHIKGCICSNGWTGTNCDEDLDECLVPNICNDSFKICLNTKGSYVCNCRDGYVLNTNGSCTDLDECNDPVLNTCQQVCNNEAGGFSCSCSYGYVQSRNSTSVCEDIDECTVGQSGCEQLCHNSEGRFTCDCHFGYILNNDRKTCMKVTDLCVTYGNINCSQICILEDAQVVCSCRHGYKLSSDNQTCEDVNECEDQQLNRCSNNCTNHNFGYTCSCANGSQLDNDGRTCKACDAFHYGPNCSDPCNCGVGADRCDPITGCVCSDGWHGRKCDQDVNECVQNPCSDNNSFCFNTAGSYVCNCLLGYRNVSGVCQDIDECNDARLNDCNHICLNNIGSYRCTCHEGFVSNGNVCSDCKANKYGQDCMYDCSCHMPNTQTCDSINGTCTCREGWEGAECNIDIDECSNSSSCDAVNTICVNRNGSYSCECSEGYVMDSDTQCKATSPITTSATTPTTGSTMTSTTSTSMAEASTTSVTIKGEITTRPESTASEVTSSTTTATAKTSVTTELKTSTPSLTTTIARNLSTSTPTTDVTSMPHTNTSFTTADTSSDRTTTSEGTTSQTIMTMTAKSKSSTTLLSATTSPLMTSNSTTSTLSSTVGRTTTTSSSSSVTAADTSKTTSSGGITATSERTTAQTTTPATTTTSQITTMLALTSPSLMTSNSPTSTLSSTVGPTTMTSSNSSVTAADTSKTTSSGGITATSEHTTAQTTTPATTTTSQITTMLALTSPSLMTSNSTTSTLSSTAEATTTTSSSSSVTSVDTSKTTPTATSGTTATSESSAPKTTTPAVTVTYEITTTSILTPPFAASSINSTSKFTPTAGASTTPSLSSSVTTVETSKTTSSGGITATSESITAQTTAPAMTTKSKITTSVITGSSSSTSSVNPTSSLAPTAEASTTPSSSSSVTTVDTSETTSSGVTTEKFKSTTAPTTAPAVETTSEITTTLVMTSTSLTSTSSAIQSTVTNGVTTTPTTSMLTAATNNTTIVATTISKNSTSHISMPTNTTTSQLYTSSTITIGTSQITTGTSQITTGTSQITTSSTSTSTPWTSSSSLSSTISGTSSPSTSAMTSSSSTTTSTKETTTSTAACTNNTFGMNCSLHCNCNISNSINKSQACDPNNGICLCKEGWMGVNCSQDVNECEINPEICREMNNSGCYNAYGSFKCQCHIGYMFDGNRTCMEDVLKTTTPMTVNATDSKYKAVITLDFNLHASIDIKVPENYAKVELDVQDALSEFYRTKMDQLFVRVVVVSIRRGSLIVEYFTVTRDSDDALLKLGDANAKLASGEKISVAGENSSALRLNVEGNDLPNDTPADQVLCKSYLSLRGACTTGYECILIDSRPTCAPKKKEDNFILTVAVATGTSLSVLIILVIAAVLFYKRKTTQWKTSKDLIYRSDSISNQTNRYIATKWHTSDLMKHVSYGFNPSDMLGHSPHPYKQNYYQGNEEGNMENNLSGSSYLDEVNSSASKKEFKIKRPKVYGVGNVSYDNGIYN